jgi:hypothetical protein
MILVRVQMQAQLLWQVTRDPKSDRWVAVCQPLAITAEAETWEKLTALMNEEVNELLRALLEAGELDKFFRDRGWQSMPETPLPKTTPIEGIRFDVPMDIQAVPDFSKLNTRHAQA